MIEQPCRPFHRANTDRESAKGQAAWSVDRVRTARSGVWWWWVGGWEHKPRSFKAFKVQINQLDDIGNHCNSIKVSKSLAHSHMEHVKGIATISFHRIQISARES